MNTEEDNKEYNNSDNHNENTESKSSDSYKINRSYYSESLLKKGSAGGEFRSWIKNHSNKKNSRNQ